MNTWKLWQVLLRDCADRLHLLSYGFENLAFHVGGVPYHHQLWTDVRRPWLWHFWPIKT